MIATNDQKIFRTYGPSGSIFKCEGEKVSPRIICKLIANHLIEDEPQTAVTASSLTTVRMRLSKAGFDFLKADI